MTVVFVSFVATMAIALLYRANTNTAKLIIGKVGKPGTFQGLIVSLSAFLLTGFLLIAFPQMPDVMGILVVLLFTVSTFAAMAFTTILIITSALG